MKNFTISCTVSEARFPTIMTLLTREGIQRLVATEVPNGVIPAAKAVAVTKVPEKGRRHRSTKTEGTKYGAAILALLRTKNGAFTMMDIADHMSKQHGISYHVATYYVNKLLSENAQIVRMTRGAYRVPTASEGLELIAKRQQAAGV